MGNQQLTASQATKVVAQQAVAEQKLNADTVYLMNPAELAAAIGFDVNLAALVIRQRPSVSGEVIQAALSSGQTSTAMLVTTAIRFDFLNGWGASAQSQELVRAVMRVTGPGAEHVRAAMQSIVDDLHAKQAESSVQHRSFASVDGLDATMQFAQQDPDGAKLVANYYDRPDDAVAQLLGEAARDVKAYRRHVSLLEGRIRASPSSAIAFVHVAMRQQSPEALDLKRWLVSELDHVIAPDLYKVNTGDQDMVEGGPQARAERLVPLLAELIAEPDVSLAFAQLAEHVGQDLPDHVPPLRSILRHVLHRCWSDEVKKQVRHTIYEGAGELFGSALTSSDRRRLGDSRNAATYFATVAEAETQVGLKRSMKSALGELLTVAASYVPVGGKEIGRGAKILTALSKGEDEVPEYTDAMLDAMLRRVYETIKPRPPGQDGDEVVRDYNADYFAWSAGPQNEFSRVLNRDKGK